MKQWLYDGWFRFKVWVIFNYWKFSHTEEDHKALVELYNKKIWEQLAMKAYVEYLNTHSEELVKYKAESWYVGTINPEKMMNATLEKKDE